MSIFKFRPKVPTTGQELVHKIRLKQRLTNEEPWIQVGEDILLSSLLYDDIEDKYTVNEPLAINTKFTRITFLSEDGVEGQPVDLPPKDNNVSFITLYVFTADIGLGVMPRVDFNVSTLFPNTASAGSKLIIDAKTVKTDANGYASIQIPADINSVRITVGKSINIQKFDTNGKGGQMVNIKDLL